MGRKTSSNANYPVWSDSKFWGFVRSGLRRKWIMWPPRFEVIKQSRRPVRGMRHKWEIKCSKCNKWYKQKDIQVDHIVPVGTLKSYSHLAGFVKRLFVPSNKLRVLCRGCHLLITKKATKKTRTKGSV